MTFKLHSKFKPAGDQPYAIDFLTEGVLAGYQSQTLLGITGSGKTFTMANIIAKTGKPTLILSHNKTLAAQLFAEFKEFFPENHVEYFVSYYDYYQPEAYVPRRDLYIEKEVEINENIERYRSSATQALLTKRDVIVVATVSCIYGLGNPDDYLSLSRTLKVGDTYARNKLLRHLADLQYERRDNDFFKATYRVRGDVVDINTVAEETAVRVEYFGDEIESIKIINPLTGEIVDQPREVTVFPAKPYVTPYEMLKDAIPRIRADLEREVAAFEKADKIVEAQRLKQRTNYDLEMLQEVGYVSGIENYSRYIENRPIGSPPSTLIDYFPDDWLLFVDESHITMPQFRGMYNGDRARKENLVQHGFRINSAYDNRPLKFEEFYSKLNQTIYVSATPSEFEINASKYSPDIENLKKKEAKLTIPDKPKAYRITQQIIRPTGLLDPVIDIRPSETRYKDQLAQDIQKHNYTQMTYHPKNQDKGFEYIDQYDPQFAREDTTALNQIDDLFVEIQQNIKNNQRTIITTLTKRMAEDLTTFLQDHKIKTSYIHSDVETMERVEILKNLRLGIFDVLVGINLLREGIDLPEVSMIAIIDADKEGFLRSDTSLIQIIGRAARHQNGRVIMYADKITRSMKSAIDTTLTRRQTQKDYNIQHNISPTTIQKEIKNQLDQLIAEKPEKSKDTNLIKKSELYPSMTPKERKQYKKELEVQMDIYADMLEYEKAAEIRDLLKSL